MSALDSVALVVCAFVCVLGSRSSRGAVAATVGDDAARYFPVSFGGLRTSRSGLCACTICGGWSSSCSVCFMAAAAAAGSSSAGLSLAGFFAVKSRFMAAGLHGEFVKICRSPLCTNGKADLHVAVCRGRPSPAAIIDGWAAKPVGQTTAMPCNHCTSTAAAVRCLLPHIRLQQSRMISLLHMHTPDALEQKRRNKTRE
ncbi:hypothetical protein BC831DRAFT_482301 [Entophlyctis helioformis]|nr:hypothetical protein BC831DRAFT_482301 [Entophlyctis helioformis]